MHVKDKVKSYSEYLESESYGLYEKMLKQMTRQVKPVKPVEAKTEAYGVIPENDNALGYANDFGFKWELPTPPPVDYEPMKTITVKEYEELVANQKPDDWREDTVLINIETLAEALTEKMVALLGSEDRSVIYDEMYDLIYKCKV